MSKKSVKLLASVLAMAVSPLVGAAGVSDDVVKIGVLTDMSGVYADVGGKGALVAAQMAVKDFGGKVLNKRIEVVYDDHKNDVDTGLAIAKRWFEKDRTKVDVVVELMNSQVATAVSKYAAEQKRIAVKTGAATSALTNDECTRYTIDWVYDSYAVSLGTLRELLADGIKTYTIMVTDYGDKTDKAFSKDIFIAANMVRKKGGKIFFPPIKVPASSTDFTPYLLKAQEQGANGILFAQAGGDFVNAVKQAREFGLFSETQEPVGMVVFDSDIKALGLDMAQGMKFTTGFYWDRDNDSREWSRRYYAQMKKMPTSSQAGVYSAVMHYLRAVQSSGTDSADDVMSKMKSTRINDFFAKDGYVREDGRMIHDMYLAEVKKPSESKGEAQWDLLKIKRTIKGENIFRPLAQSACPLVKK
ncbi:MAG TPA: ABC transporter substrate-binding protein [Turneriella sp.]|nr:ABC transporter substrate-binding protein [Turneriella sp.]